MNPETPKESCPYSAQPIDSEGPSLPVEKRWDASDLHQLLGQSRGLLVGLEEAARQAWRNSVRCSGRARWRSLKVIDGRSVSSADEIFDALFELLSLATESRAAQPFMSVFPEFDPLQPEIRIWNHQLISYAGYLAADGTVLGDPANCQLTQIAIDLGWQPPSQRTRFDILPIILQCGGKLHLRSLPVGAVAEVAIRHPEHPKVEALGLRWYATPIVSDMLFATEKAIYPAAPFSGHYVSTEIAARNFSDKNRYNQLPQIASAMGIEPSKKSRHWIDHALIALNEAVLWSFKKEGYRIVDHHTVSSEFVSFCKKENSNNREVRGDWAWLVPPISGAASPIFSQSFELKVELPNFLYQKLPY